MSNRKREWPPIPQIIRLCTVILGMAIALYVFSGTPALAGDTGTEAKLFEIHCVGCHPQGGNIIRRGKTLKQAALQKNKVDTLEAIATLVANGKNNMPAFQDRLSPAEINEVSAYVLEKAAQGWR
jgi:cytochrome c6